MIRKNGDNKWSIDVSAFLQVLVILGGLFVFYLKTTGEIANSIDKIKDKISIINVTVAKHGVRINRCEDDIEEIKGK